MFFYRWANLCDSGPTVKKHRVNGLCQFVYIDNVETSHRIHVFNCLLKCRITLMLPIFQVIFHSFEAGIANAISIFK